MKRKRKEQPGLTREGLRNTLITLLNLQEGEIIFYHSNMLKPKMLEDIEDPQDKDHVLRYLEKAFRQGYLKKASILHSIGRGSSAANIGYRIKEDKISKVERLV